MNVALDPKHAEEFFDVFGAPKCDPPAANPRFETANDDPAVHANGSPEVSLVEELGAVADELRQIHTDLGTRPYRVFSVVYEWTGGEVGRGEPRVLSEQEILPTPLVDISGSSRGTTAAGSKSEGTAKLTEVSPRYTEDQIHALFPTRLQGAQRAFIEVRMDARDGSEPIRRRYTIKMAPYRNPTRFEWVVRLNAQEQDRTRAGEISTPKFYPKRLNREGPPGAGDA